jgi:hypothetical protein
MVSTIRSALLRALLDEARTEKGAQFFLQGAKNRERLGASEPRGRAGF